jgi:glycosyltransferase involved in cell wall biosynthesis
MGSELPKVSVIVPCYNEVRFVDQLVWNIAGQDYPRHLIEVIFADGMSNDGTRDKLRTLSDQFAFIRVIDNPQRYVPSALNYAIGQSTGEIIIRLDAHAVYPDNYFSRLVTALLDRDAANVGGVWETRAGADTDEAKAIVLATSHPLGIGNASYRLGGKAERYVDTVPYGCFRRSLFEKIGYFDEDLLRNQDDEFNGRIIRAGGKILLLPDLKIGYYARETRKKLSTMFYQYGLFKPLVNVKLGAPATWRQFVPPVFVMCLFALAFASIFSKSAFLLLLFILFFYTTALLLVSIRIAGPNGLSMIWQTAKTFPVIHFSYGIGYIFGLYRYALKKSHLRSDSAKVNTSR